MVLVGWVEVELRSPGEYVAGEVQQQLGEEKAGSCRIRKH